MDLPVQVGNILSSDFFYQPDPESWRHWAKFGVLAVEMETAALYPLAARYGIQALTLLTVSDSLVTGAALSPEDRERSFAAMMELALAVGISA
jgi:purine-nucleoside phosphorylase